MSRLIWLSDEKKRDAQVALESPPRPDRTGYLSPEGRPVRSERLIRSTDGHTLEALQHAHPDPEALAQALVQGDPEIDLEQVGRKVGDADRVWLDPDGRLLYSAKALRVVLDASGQERAREPFTDVEATVSEETPLPYSGRLFPIEEVVRHFALARSLQLRHVNGLTFDFLFEIARALHEARKMLFVGSGPKGMQPLVFSTNGSPYRGFLEGRVADESYRLVLHLANLELKAVPS